MRLAEESTVKVDVSEQTWRAAADRLTDRQMVELSLSIAWYNSGVRIMGLLDIDLEDNYPNPFANS
jgi:alkylhydroperoxidase family enzyme